MWPPFCFPLLTFLLAWKWVRSEELEAPLHKDRRDLSCSWPVFAAAFSLAGPWTLFGGAIRVGGIAGTWSATGCCDAFNLAGALIVTCTCFIVSIYLVSTFSVSKLADWLAGPIACFSTLAAALARAARDQAQA